MVGTIISKHTRRKLKEANLNAVSGGDSETTVSVDHEVCSLCGTDVYFTNGMTMEIHQAGLPCKMLRS